MATALRRLSDDVHRYQNVGAELPLHVDTGNLSALATEPRLQTAHYDRLVSCCEFTLGLAHRLVQEGSLNTHCSNQLSASEVCVLRVHERVHLRLHAVGANNMMC